MKRYRWILCISFLGGILIANLMGNEILNSYGILNSYFIDRFLNSVIDYEALLIRILAQRLKVVFWILVFDFFLQKSYLQKGIGICLAVSFGIFTTAAIFNFGIKGMLLVFLALFPQWIFYLGGFFVFLIFRTRREQHVGQHYDYGGVKSKNIMLMTIYFIFVTLMMAGILTESYINPIILKKLLKIF